MSSQENGSEANSQMNVDEVMEVVSIQGCHLEVFHLSRKLRSLERIVFRVDFATKASSVSW